MDCCHLNDIVGEYSSDSFHPNVLSKFRLKISPLALVEHISLEHIIMAVAKNGVKFRVPCELSSFE